MSFTNTTAPPLIGPPQNPQNSAAAEDHQESAAAAAMDATETSNLSPTFPSTGNPCLDFFYYVLPETPPETVINRLHHAWNQDPQKALKIIFNQLREAKRAAKSNKEGFYTAALWLFRHHPITLAANVASIADFGYFKDLLEILFRVLYGADARKRVREKWLSRKWKKTGPLCIARMNRQPLIRRLKNFLRAKKLIHRYNTDGPFQLLHHLISHLFAHRLRSDMEMLKLGELSKISLAAKWCPSLNSSFDRFTLVCETIAKFVFPREEYAEYEGVEEAHYAYRVRDRLRKEVLVPLRRALELPEVYIGANNWGSLPYNRVSSVAMKNYMWRFLKHDKERFKEYLKQVKKTRKKITAAVTALLPHEITASVDYEGEMAELQWKRVVEEMAKIGKLGNCVAICDVSMSMNGIPMAVSVALGLLVSELSEEPWKGKVITFSQNPKLQVVEGDSLKAKVNFVEKMGWDEKADLQKVFDLILQVAEEGKLMVKRVFVFSDMEFDQASQNPWETDYEEIVRKYREKGYGECVPEIVYWNLRDSRARAMPAKEKGVALVSGFSKKLMRKFLEKGGVMDPVAEMEAAISGKEYEKVVVLD